MMRLGFERMGRLAAWGVVVGLGVGLSACGKGEGPAPVAAADATASTGESPKEEETPAKPAEPATAAEAATKPTEPAPQVEAPGPAYVTAPKPPEAPMDNAAAAPAVDFKKLAAEAFDAQGQPRSPEAMSALWAPVFQLPAWHVLLVPTSDLLDPKVLIRELNGQVWVFAFTDTAEARTFAAANKLLDDAGNARIMSVPMPGAKAWLEGFEAGKVHGVQFNFGAPGWFSPLKQLEPIRAFLVEKGYLK